jgi:MFS family permease
VKSPTYGEAFTTARSCRAYQALGTLEADMSIQSIYLLLLTLQTLAASFIWGVNTLFLLDAGLSNFEAFAANAFFTVGMVIFEIPTGIIADSYGRRLSYLLGTITLFVSTLLYMVLWQHHATFWLWAAVSMFLGLGFTFFSGAVDAWLVDALTESRFFETGGVLDSVFGRGQIAMGASTLVGSVAGGYIAQANNLGTPYWIRAVFLLVNFVAAYFLMFDRGFVPPPRESALKQMRSLFKTSVSKGLAQRNLRWMMLTSPFLSGVMIYVFYAMQPYLLNLYGNPKAYGIAGLAAAIVAGAQMIGGTIVAFVTKLAKRTTILLVATVIGVALLIVMGAMASFMVAVSALVLWSLVFAVATPIRQSYLNARIESRERATLLSFDSVLGETGATIAQPIFGKVADVHGYPASFLCCAIVQFLALPFFMLARKEDDQV